MPPENLKPRYYWTKFGDFLKDRFGVKIGKVLINTGRPCSHRLSAGGCSFCHEESILPASANAADPVSVQIDRGLASRPRAYPANLCLAYFQRGTTTAPPLAPVRQQLLEALDHPAVAGLDLGTRPDCLDDSALELLRELAGRKPVWVDLGLQSIHDRTLQRINRGHTAACFTGAVHRLATIPGLYTVAHLIAGLPGEDDCQILESFSALSRLPLHGVKIHHLQLVRGTPLAGLYEKESWPLLTVSRFVGLLAGGLERLPRKIVIHRLMGDQPAGLLTGPRWELNKHQLARLLEAEFDRRGTSQGSSALPE